MEMIDYLKLQWQGVNDVELSIVIWLYLFNKIRTHMTIGYVSLFGFDKGYYDIFILSGIVA